MWKHFLTPLAGSPATPLRPSFPFRPIGPVSPLKSKSKYVMKRIFVLHAISIMTHSKPVCHKLLLCVKPNQSKIKCRVCLCFNVFIFKDSIFVLGSESSIKKPDGSQDNDFSDNHFQSTWLPQIKNHCRRKNVQFFKTFPLRLDKLAHVRI